MLRKTAPIRPELAEHIKAATVAKNDAKETYDVHLARWKDAIVIAIDEGAGQVELAALAGVSQSRIVAIVADVYSKAGA